MKTYLTVGVAVIIAIVLLLFVMPSSNVGQNSKLVGGETYQVPDVPFKKIPAKTVLRFWEDVNPVFQRELKVQALILFPELFAKYPNFQPLADWLQDKHSIYVERVQVIFETDDQTSKLPPIYQTLQNNLPTFNQQFRTLPSSLLERSWNTTNVSERLFFRFDIWARRTLPLMEETIGKKPAADLMLQVSNAVK